jgi:hypothetical protein
MVTQQPEENAGMKEFYDANDNFTIFNPVLVIYFGERKYTECTHEMHTISL